MLDSLCRESPVRLPAGNRQFPRGSLALPLLVHCLQRAGALFWPAEQIGFGEGPVSIQPSRAAKRVTPVS